MVFGVPSNFPPPGYDSQTDPFNFFPVPESTGYRSANLVVLEHLPKERFLLDCQELISMKQKDDAFVTRLENKDYHNMFWHLTAWRWEPRTLAEEQARESFQQAIANRLDLVILQKVLLGKAWLDIPEYDREGIYKIVDEEMVFARKWLGETKLPNYSDTRIKYEKVFANNFLENP